MVDPNLFDDIEKYLESGVAPWSSNAPVSQDEFKTLVKSAHRATGRAITEEEAFMLLRWAESARASIALFDLVMKGFADIIPNMENKSDPGFKITGHGKKVVDAGTQIS